MDDIIESDFNRRLFDNEQQAKDFACLKVRDMWCVHFRPTSDEKWEVTWWCQ